MTNDDLIAALALPPESKVERRVAKRLLAEQGVDTTGIAEARWVAALKPATVGVPACAEAIEIQVLALILSPEAKPERIAGQIHRAILYPVLLAIELAGTEPAISLHSPAGGAQFCSLGNDALTRAWLPRLALAAQPRTDLGALYQGWVEAVEALRAARISGTLGAAPPEDRRQALEDHARLQREIARLRQQAAKEKQMGRRVDLNLRLKQLESEFALATARL